METFLSFSIDICWIKYVQKHLTLSIIAHTASWTAFIYLILFCVLALISGINIASDSFWFHVGTSRNDPYLLRVYSINVNWQRGLLVLAKLRCSHSSWVLLLITRKPERNLTSNRRNTPKAEKEKVGYFGVSGYQDWHGTKFPGFPVAYF